MLKAWCDRFRSQNWWGCPVRVGGRAWGGSQACVTGHTGASRLSWRSREAFPGPSGRSPPPSSDSLGPPLFFLHSTWCRARCRIIHSPSTPSGCTRCPARCGGAQHSAQHVAGAQFTLAEVISQQSRFAMTAKKHKERRSVKDKTKLQHCSFWFWCKSDEQADRFGDTSVRSGGN